MMIFDSSTLILIAKIELLNPFLKEIGMPVAIPYAVEKECCDGKKTFDSLMIRQAIDESRIKVIVARDRTLVAKLRGDFTMGWGESEAICLAIEQKARILALDDRKGIQACKLTRIAFTTAIDILVRSTQKGIIDPVDALRKLSALAQFGRYKAAILEDARLRMEAQP